eukprot:Hpha_TRINITY_DN16926_c0_g1::TRINITY_DN16926_c0_g1_i1::g.52665::m.52665
MAPCSGWLWRYSVVGRRDWCEKSWRRRWVTLDGDADRKWICWHKGEDAAGLPEGVVELQSCRSDLGLYVSDPAMGNLLGVRYREEADGDPILLLLRAETHEDQKRWAAALEAEMPTRPFSDLRQDFVTLDPAALETTPGEGGSGPPSSDDDMRERVQQWAGRGGAGDRKSTRAGAGSQDHLRRAKERLEKRKAAARTSGEGEAARVDLRSRVDAALKSGAEADAAARLLAAGALQEGGLRGRRGDAVDDMPELSGPTAASDRARFRELLRRKGGEETDDLVGRLKGMSNRLHEAGGEETGDGEDGSEESKSPVSDTRARVRQMLEQRKNRQAERVETGMQTEPDAESGKDAERVRELEDALDAAGSQAQTAATERSAAEARAEELSGEVTQLQQKLSSEEDTKRQIEAEKEAAAGRLAETEASLGALNTELADARRETETVRGELTQAVAAREAAEAELQGATARAEEAAASGEGMQGQLAALQQRVRELEAAGETAQAELDEHRNTIARAESERAELQEKLDASAAQLEEAQRQARSELDEQREAVARAESERASLQERLGASASELEEALQQAKTELDEQRDAVARAESERAALQEKLDASAAQLDEAQQQARTELDEQREAVARVESERAALQERLDASAEQLEEAQQQVEAIRAETASKGEDAEETAKAMERLQVEVEAATARAQAQQLACEEAEAQAQSAREELASVEEERDRLQSEVAEAADHLKQTRSPSPADRSVSSMGMLARSRGESQQSAADSDAKRSAGLSRFTEAIEKLLREKGELEESLRTSRADADKLEVQVRQLTADVESSAAEARAEVQGEVEELRAKLEAAEEAARSPEAADELAQARREIEELREEMAEEAAGAREVARGLLQDKKALAAEKEQATAEAEEARQEVERLQSQVQDEAEQGKEVARTLLREKEALSADLTAAQEERAGLEERLAEAEAREAELRERAAAGEGSTSEEQKPWAERVAELSSELGAARAALEARTAPAGEVPTGELRDVTAQLRAATAELRDAMPEDSATRERLQDTVAALCQRLEGDEGEGDLAAQLASAQGEVASLRERLAAAEARPASPGDLVPLDRLEGAADSKALLADLEAARAEVEKLREAGDDAGREVARKLLREKGELTAELEEARAEVEVLKATDGGDEDAGREVARRLLQEKKQLAAELEEARAELEKRQAEGEGDEEDPGREVARRLLQEKKELAAELEEARAELERRPAVDGDEEDAGREVARRLLEEKRELVSELEESRAEAERLRSTSAEGDEEDAGREVARRLLQEKRDLAAELEEARAEVERLKEPTDGEDDDAGREVARRLLQEKKELAAELEEARAELEKRQTEEEGDEENAGREVARRLLQEKKELAAELEEARAEVERLKESADEDTEDAGREVARQLLQDKKELMGELEESRAEVERLRAASTDGDEGDAGGEAARKLAAELEEAKAEVERLKESADGGDEGREVARKLLQEKNELAEELEEARAEVERLKDGEEGDVRERLLQEKTELAAELEEARGEAERLKESAEDGAEDAGREVARRLLQEKKDLAAELEEAKAEAERLKQPTDDDEGNAGREVARKLLQEKNELAAELEEARAELERRGQMDEGDEGAEGGGELARKRLQEKKELVEELEEAKAEVERLRESADTAGDAGREVARGLLRDNKELAGQLEEAKAETETLRTERQAADEATQRLQEENRSLGERLEEGRLTKENEQLSAALREAEAALQEARNESVRTAPPLSLEPLKITSPDEDAAASNQAASVLEKIERELREAGSGEAAERVARARVELLESNDADVAELGSSAVMIAAEALKEKEKLRTELAATQAKVEELRSAGKVAGRSGLSGEDAGAAARNEVVRSLLQERREVAEKLGLARAESEASSILAGISGTEGVNGELANALVRERASLVGELAAARAELEALHGEHSLQQGDGGSPPERELAKDILRDKRRMEAEIAELASSQVRDAAPEAGTPASPSSSGLLAARTQSEKERLLIEVAALRRETQQLNRDVSEADAAGQLADSPSATAVRTLLVERRALQEELGALRAELAELRGRADAAEVGDDDSDVAKEVARGLLREKRALQEQLAVLRAEAGQLRSELALAAAAADDADAGREVARRLLREKKVLEAELKTARLDVAKMGREANASESPVPREVRLAEAVDRLERENAELRETLRQLRTLGHTAESCRDPDCQYHGVRSAPASAIASPAATPIGEKPKPGYTKPEKPTSGISLEGEDHSGTEGEVAAEVLKGVLRERKEQDEELQRLRLETEELRTVAKLAATQGEEAGREVARELLRDKRELAAELAAARAEVDQQRAAAAAAKAGLVAGAEDSAAGKEVARELLRQRQSAEREAEELRKQVASMQEGEAAAREEMEQMHLRVEELSTDLDAARAELAAANSVAPGGSPRQDDAALKHEMETLMERVRVVRGDDATQGIPDKQPVSDLSAQLEADCGGLRRELQAAEAVTAALHSATPLDASGAGGGLERPLLAERRASAQALGSLRAERQELEDLAALSGAEGDDIGREVARMLLREKKELAQRLAAVQAEADELRRGRAGSAAENSGDDSAARELLRQRRSADVEADELRQENARLRARLNLVGGQGGSVVASLIASHGDTGAGQSAPPPSDPVELAAQAVREKERLQDELAAVQAEVAELRSAAKLSSEHADDPESAARLDVARTLLGERRQAAEKLGRARAASTVATTLAAVGTGPDASVARAVVREREDVAAELAAARAEAAELRGRAILSAAGTLDASAGRDVARGLLKTTRELEAAAAVWTEAAALVPLPFESEDDDVDDTGTLAARTQAAKLRLAAEVKSAEEQARELRERNASTVFDGLNAECRELLEKRRELQGELGKLRAEGSELRGRAEASSSGDGGASELANGLLKQKRELEERLADRRAEVEELQTRLSLAESGATDAQTAREVARQLLRDKKELEAELRAVREGTHLSQPTARDVHSGERSLSEAVRALEEAVDVHSLSPAVSQALGVLRSAAADPAASTGPSQAAVPDPDPSGELATAQAEAHRLRARLAALQGTPSGGVQGQDVEAQDSPSATDLAVLRAAVAGARSAGGVPDGERDIAVATIKERSEAARLLAAARSEHARLTAAMQGGESGTGADDEDTAIARAEATALRAELALMGSSPAVVRQAARDALREKAAAETELEALQKINARLHGANRARVLSMRSQAATQPLPFSGDADASASLTAGGLAVIPAAAAGGGKAQQVGFSTEAKRLKELSSHNAALESENAALAEKLAGAAQRLRQLQVAIDGMCQAAGGVWECQHCMYENDAHRTECEMCGSRSYGPITQVAGSANQEQLAKLREQAAAVQQAIADGDTDTKDGVSGLLQDRARLESALEASQAEAADLRQRGPLAQGNAEGEDGKAGVSRRALELALEESRAELAALRGGLEVLAGTDADPSDVDFAERLAVLRHAATGGSVQVPRDGAGRGASATPLAGGSSAVADALSRAGLVAAVEAALHSCPSTAPDALRRLSSIRTLATQRPLPFDDITTEVDALRGAGVSPGALRRIEDAALAASGASQATPTPQTGRAGLLHAVDVESRLCPPGVPEGRRRLNSLRSLASLQPLPLDEIAAEIDALRGAGMPPDAVQRLEGAVLVASGLGRADEDGATGRSSQALLAANVAGLLRAGASAGAARQGEEPLGAAGTGGLLRTVDDVLRACPPGAHAARRRLNSMRSLAAVQPLPFEELAADLRALEGAGVPPDAIRRLEGSVLSAAESARASEGVRAESPPSGECIPDGSHVPGVDTNPLLHAVDTALRCCPPGAHEARRRLGSIRSLAVMQPLPVDELIDAADSIPPTGFPSEVLQNVREQAAALAAATAAESAQLSESLEELQQGLQGLSEAGALRDASPELRQFVEELVGGSADAHAAARAEARALQNALRSLAAHPGAMPAADAEAVLAAGSAPTGGAALRQHLAALRSAAARALASGDITGAPVELLCELQGALATGQSGNALPGPQELRKRIAEAEAAVRAVSFAPGLAPELREAALELLPPAARPEKQREHRAVSLEKSSRSLAADRPIPDGSSILDATDSGMQPGHVFASGVGGAGVHEETLAVLERQIAERDSRIAVLEAQVRDFGAGSSELQDHVTALRGAHADVANRVGDGLIAALNGASALLGPQLEEAAATARGDVGALRDLALATADDERIPADMRQQLRTAAAAYDGALRAEAADLRAALEAAREAGVPAVSTGHVPVAAARGQSTRTLDKRPGDLLREEVSRLEQALGEPHTPLVDLDALEGRAALLRAESLRRESLSRPGTTANLAGGIGATMTDQDLERTVPSAIDLRALPTGMSSRGGVEKAPEGEIRSALREVLRNTGARALGGDLLNRLRALAGVPGEDGVLLSPVPVEETGPGSENAELQHLDAAVAEAVRTVLRSPSVPDSVKRAISTALVSPPANTAAVVAAVEDALITGLPPAAAVAVADVAAAADRSVAREISTMQASIRSGQATPAMEASIGRAENSLRTLVDALTGAAAVEGLPEDLRRALTDALAASTEASGAEAAVRHTLHSSGADELEDRDNEGDSFPADAHVALPSAARLALSSADMPPEVRSALRDALLSASSRCSPLCDASAQADWDGVTGGFERTSSAELSRPGVRESVAKVLADGGADVPPMLRRRLEMLQGAGGEGEAKLAALAPGDRAEVVVLEPPGVGDWLGCGVQDRMADGTYRIRVDPLPQEHPASRFGDRLLRVAGEHLRTVGPAVAPLAEGQRVVRNPHHWQGGVADGGPGGLGSVLSCADGWATVAWDQGHQGRYRWGAGQAYEVRPAAPPPRPPPRLGMRVTRDAVHWSAGQDDGGAGQPGTVVRVRDGSVRVAWDAGGEGEYAWGTGGIWEVAEASGGLSSPDEEGLRAALRSALGAGAGDALPADLSRQLWTAAGPGSPRRKVLAEVAELVREHGEVEEGQDRQAALEQEVWRLHQALDAATALLGQVEPYADGFPSHLRSELRARSGRMQSPQAHIRQSPLAPEDAAAASPSPQRAPQVAQASPQGASADGEGLSDEDDTERLLRARLRDAERLLQAAAAACNSGQPPPELARQLASFAAQPAPPPRRRRRKSDRRWLLKALRGELSARGEELAVRLSGAVQQQSESSVPREDAPDTTDTATGDSRAELRLRDSATQCDLPTRRSRETSRATEALEALLEVERAKVRELQQQLILFRPAPSGARPAVETDARLQRKLRALNLLPEGSPSPRRASPRRASPPPRRETSRRASPRRGELGSEAFSEPPIVCPEGGEVVAVSEFPAVRVGGGYMLFSDFVRRFGGGEGRHIVVTKDAAEPQALVRQGGQMLFVEPPAEGDPQPIYAAGVGPGGGARSPSPRRTRQTFEQVQPHGESDAGSRSRRTRELTPPSPRSRSGEPPSELPSASPRPRPPAVRGISGSPRPLAKPNPARSPEEVEEVDDVRTDVAPTEVEEILDTDAGPRPLQESVSRASTRASTDRPADRGPSNLSRGTGTGPKRRSFMLASHPTKPTARIGAAEPSAYLGHAPRRGAAPVSVPTGRRHVPPPPVRGRPPPRPV